ncbi:(Fe-S)-binding protein, partial [Thermodesulfobacteriota bacterium]
MYNPKDIIDLIADNVSKTRNPFGIPKPLVNNWWKNRRVNGKGDALLFTGLMYQFGPYIEKSTRYLDNFEDTFWANYIRLAKYVPKLLSGLSLAFLASRDEKKKYNGILQNITEILIKSDVDFYYDPELDNYSGILLYDLGDQESFVRHATYVADRLKQAGVENLITVD